jgi:hypothetical protein
VCRNNRQAYENSLPPMSKRNWLIDEDDMSQVVSKSDESRYSCQAWMCIASGVFIIGDIVCQCGHSLGLVDFKRTAFEINGDTLSLLGNITRETSREALREILRQNLRSDYNKHGERGGGRAAIMADPFNPGDHASNWFQQHAQGQARIVIDKNRWWGDIGEKANDSVGVIFSVAGAGAITFSNTVYNVTTVIPVEYFKAIYVHSRWEKRALGNVEVAHSDHIIKCGGHSSTTDDIDLTKEYGIEWSKTYDGECAINPFITGEELVITKEDGESYRAGFGYISALPAVLSVEAGQVPESLPKWAQDAEFLSWEQVRERDSMSMAPKLTIPTTDVVKNLIPIARVRLITKLTMFVSWLAKAY